ncbi:DUF6446 family protein [Jannaschia sp. W003]|uniref:DUF6446 family protein n=1 Tax=Jannaschia sp. W003 TaxID=2867012 RepID=UPI0021A6BE3B|nr:DUF6446 family protein [Jannaschia sp. W003]UWQ21095.1 DUF6446 family protein [Jannaschia sp. W003]
MGKVVVIALLLACLIGGAGLWYSQAYAYWDRVEGPVTLTLEEEGRRVPLAAWDVEAIVSRSSPLGFRACFTHDVPPHEAPDRPRPAPTVAPGWFDCFDAAAIAALIESGEATAHTAWTDAAYGVDRVVALARDGRGWAWHELNDCGAKAYDGSATAPACPDRATFQPLEDR